MPRKSRKKPFILGVPQFFERSPNEASVRAFIEKCLWEDGIAICPKYAARNALFEVRKPRLRFCKHREGRYRCKGCGKVHSVESVTAFHKSKLHMRVWRYAFFLCRIFDPDIESEQMAMELGATQESVSAIRDRLRKVCGADRLPAGLSDESEMDIPPH